MLLLLLGWTMGTFWSWMVWPSRSMSIHLPPSCNGPGSTLPTGGYPSTSRPAGFCGEGFVGLCHRVCKVCPGWVPEREMGHFQCRLWGGFCLWQVVVACLTLARASTVHWEWLCQRRNRAGPWCELIHCEARRAGLGVDGGKCRGGVDHPNGAIGNSPSVVKCLKVAEKWP